VEFISTKKSVIIVGYGCYIVGRDSSVGIATRYGIPVQARFSALVQKGPRVHPASYAMGTESFPGVKGPGRSVDYPNHLPPRLKSRAIPLLPLWNFVACSRVKFNLLYFTLLYVTLYIFKLNCSIKSKRQFLGCATIAFSERYAL
jgi:hypothetical protein